MPNPWVAVDVGLPDSTKVRRFADRLFPPGESADASADNPQTQPQTVPRWVARAAAEGLLVNLWGCVLQHQHDGILTSRDDDELELWARWQGTPGVFARAYRHLFVSHGRINDWDEHQGKWIARREQDRRRSAARRQALASGGPSADASADATSGQSADATADRPHLQHSTAPHSTEAAASNGKGAGRMPLLNVGYLTQCVEAANAAMEANPRIQTFRPLLALSQTVTWADDGIPTDLAVSVITERTSAYKPKGTNRQVSSLAYFDSAVREKWLDLQGGTGAAPDAPPATMRSTLLAKRGF